jgi:hypothetical protein
MAGSECALVSNDCAKSVKVPAGPPAPAALPRLRTQPAALDRRRHSPSHVYPYNLPPVPSLCLFKQTPAGPVTPSIGRLALAPAPIGGGGQVVEWRSAEARRASSSSYTTST